MRCHTFGGPCSIMNKQGVNGLFAKYNGFETFKELSLERNKSYFPIFGDEMIGGESKSLRFCPTSKFPGRNFLS